MLLELIETSGGNPAPVTYIDPRDHLVGQESLSAALAERLHDRLVFGTPSIQPGKMLLTMITQKDGRVDEPTAGLNLEPGYDTLNCPHMGPN